jgi:hypothetical protein
MACASPGTDTSTDLDTDDKNQMVLIVLKFFVDGQCITNVDVIILFKKNLDIP